MKNNSVIKALRAIQYALITTICLYSAPSKSNNHKSTLAIQQQTIIVSGTITDNLAPMAGVSIMVKGKNTTTNSDYNGQYTIDASPTDILIFYFMGYKTQEIPINAQKVINVKLQEEATSLQEVKINAGYYSVKESERTGSIARITSKDIETQPVTNVLATMQGRMAGVNITQTTGVPGGGFDIQIRGRNSLRLDGNSPLYIIDGAPYASEPIGSSFTSSTTPQSTSPLNSLNPADIQSIEILKDADATAIYGSRGANGVVLITTKRGKEGKTNFTANYSNGVGQVTRFLKLMNTSQYLQMRREAYKNDGITNYPEAAYDINGNWSQNRDTDWQKELTGGTAMFTNLQTSLSGGSAQTQFILSGNYSKETTVFPGNFKYNKGNFHLNVNHQSDSKKFKINTTTSYSIQDNLLPSVDFTREAIKLPPNAPALYDINGKINWENNTFNNPLALLSGKFDSNTYDLLANSIVSYDLLKGLAIKSNFGFNDLRHEETQTLPSTRYNPSYGIGSEASSIFKNRTNRQSWIIEPQLVYNYEHTNLKINILTGATFQQQNSNQIVNSGYGFASNSLINDPAAAYQYKLRNSNQSVYKYQAFFGRINVNWKDRYIINLTGRRDGSSRFGPGKQFAVFGAAGMAWLFGNEKIIKENLPFLSFGKLRTSYGTTGNDQIGDYQYLDTYSISGSHYQGINGLAPTRLFNPDFAWETNKKIEVALEIGVLNDRIFSTVGWYKNRSSNQLVGNPLPGTTGFSEVQANLNATVENTGLEISLRTINIKTSKINWTTNLNFTQPRNKLISFPDLEGSTYKYQFEIGKPLNSTKVYKYLGLDTQSGIYQFEDVNGDQIISAGADKKYSVDLNPKFYGGLQNQLQYGPVQLDFLFQFVKQLNFNQTFSAPMPGLMINQPTAAIAHWQSAGDSEPFQIYSSGNKYNVQVANTRHAQSNAGISDASYIRLKNISLSFDLPHRWTKNIKCKVSIQGQNMLTITSYKGADPEFKTAGFLPPLRIYTSSLQLIF
ncbi:SusC/RagA family TonB-linked outer membrane protein [Flavobacterium sp. TMP13]|uniref:SusC/RagA family TonB-linked outer membrane protein n=1 Tax=Flavobacterium sp. TMP13 TaxID=3425950 RepID=UPI003D77316A